MLPARPSRSSDDFSVGILQYVQTIECSSQIRGVSTESEGRENEWKPPENIDDLNCCDLCLEAPLELRAETIDRSRTVID